MWPKACAYKKIGGNGAKGCPQQPTRTALDANSRNSWPSFSKVSKQNLARVFFAVFGGHSVRFALDDIIAPFRRGQATRLC